MSSRQTDRKSKFMNPFDGNFIENDNFGYFDDVLEGREFLINKLKEFEKSNKNLFVAKTVTGVGKTISTILHCLEQDEPLIYVNDKISDLDEMHRFILKQGISEESTIVIKGVLHYVGLYREEMYKDSDKLTKKGFNSQFVLNQAGLNEDEQEKYFIQYNEKTLKQKRVILLTKKAFLSSKFQNILTNLHKSRIIIDEEFLTIEEYSKIKRRRLELDIDTVKQFRIDNPKIKCLKVLEAHKKLVSDFLYCIEKGDFWKKLDCEEVRNISPVQSDIYYWNPVIMGFNTQRFLSNKSNLSKGFLYFNSEYELATKIVKNIVDNFGDMNSFLKSLNAFAEKVYKITKMSFFELYQIVGEFQFAKSFLEYSDLIKIVKKHQDGNEIIYQTPNYNKIKDLVNIVGKHKVYLLDASISTDLSFLLFLKYFLSQNCSNYHHKQKLLNCFLNNIFYVNIDIFNDNTAIFSQTMNWGNKSSYGKSSRFYSSGKII